MQQIGVLGADRRGGNAWSVRVVDGQSGMRRAKRSRRQRPQQHRDRAGPSGRGGTMGPHLDELSVVGGSGHGVIEEDDLPAHRRAQSRDLRDGAGFDHLGRGAAADAVAQRRDGETVADAGRRRQDFGRLLAADPVRHLHRLRPRSETILLELLQRPLHCRSRARRSGKPCPDGVRQLLQPRVGDPAGERAAHQLLRNLRGNGTDSEQQREQQGASRRRRTLSHEIRGGSASACSAPRTMSRGLACRSCAL